MLHELPHANILAEVSRIQIAYGLKFIENINYSAGFISGDNVGN